MRPARSRIRPTLVFIGLIIVAALSPASGAGPSRKADPGHIAAGYKAGFTCSAVFTAGRDPAAVRKEEMVGGDPTVFMVPGAKIDYESRSVSVAYSPFSAPRLAVDTEDFGCVLLPPSAVIADRDRLPQVDLPAPDGDPAAMPWPDGDLILEQALPPEVDQKKLDAVVEQAFTGAKYRPPKTLGVVVVYQGQIIAERYAPGWGMNVQRRTSSSARASRTPWWASWCGKAS